MGEKSRRTDGMYELKQKSIEYGNVGFALLAIRYIEEKRFCETSNDDDDNYYSAATTTSTMPLKKNAR